MVAKIIFTTVFFFNVLMVASQINLGFGQDCMDKNTGWVVRFFHEIVLFLFDINKVIITNIFLI
ncbi:hypothetical protein SDC9_179311 [bioreactor metagenome]|uniref:Uncharacterized protein n=1 Tax=bioreactor metagenome TaxID=1076179 RepID=A0A645H035_9ZZZZ